MIVFGLFSAIRKYEVGIASNRISERYGEYFFGSRTHRPSRGESWGRLTCAGSLLVCWLFYAQDLRVESSTGELQRKRAGGCCVLEGHKTKKKEISKLLVYYCVLHLC